MPAFGSAVEQRLRVPLELDPPSTIFVFAVQAPHEPDKSATGPVCACTARYFDKLALGSRFLLHDALSAWPHPVVAFPQKQKLLCLKSTTFSLEFEGCGDRYRGDVKRVRSCIFLFKNQLYYFNY